MSDIFISYKREDQDRARQLATALEKQGWSVWWDPKLHAGEYFDDVIEKALKEARCVIVLWSKLSVHSRYVRDESSYALKHNKLVPVALEEVELPFRFSAIHTPQLIDWDGTEELPAFKSLVNDIAAKLGWPTVIKPAQAPPRTVVDKQPAARIFQDTLKDGGKGPEMLFIQGGEFYMGSDAGLDSYADDSEQPRHRVTMKAFYMGTYPVTFADYDAFAEATGRERPDDMGWGRGRRPVIKVTWEDAVAYSQWLSEQTGNSYRLPTEAEWEYAARAGTQTRWYWGNNEEAAVDYAWFETNSDGRTHEVGDKNPNTFGLHDMAGNVWNWTEDCWHYNYVNAPENGRAWLEKDGGDCAMRVLRGGSCRRGLSFLRPAFRAGGDPHYRDGFVGFRLVCLPLSGTVNFTLN